MLASAESDEMATVSPLTDTESNEEEEVWAMHWKGGTITSLFIVFCHIQEESTYWEAESVHSKGIPGWDKVDRLTKALLLLSGLSVTNAQASQI